MIKENIQLKGENYTLYINYQEDEKLRHEFNRLTQEFWEFDFENFYQSGYWDNSCILYSLFDGEKIVSHTTVSQFEVGEKKLFQLGTVMTDKAYQHQGLSRFLMERINKDFADKTAGSFLFANETVLEFYPKFSYVAVPEFETLQTIENLQLSQGVAKRKLNLDLASDLNLFERLVTESTDNSKFATKSKALAFFYCFAYPEMGYKDNIYYIEALDCAVIAEQAEEHLHIVDLFSPNKIDLQELLSSFADNEFQEVSFGFTPLQADFQHREWKDEDLHLFVSPTLTQFFDETKIKIASIAHT